MRRLMIILPALLVAGCAASPSTPVVVPLESAAADPVRPMSTGLFAPETTAGAGMAETLAEGKFDPRSTTAITYDPRIVPAGAAAHVTLTRTAGGMQVRLAVTGMLPRHTYGAHLHTKPCLPDPVGAGPHYQHNPDPMASASPPSVDPSYANPQNEVWLDFTADRLGAATATSVLTWSFDELTPPRSLIVHISRTRTEEGLAGTAGARVACLTLPG
jgi:Cu-Zn family superoxide dismutase